MRQELFFFSFGRNLLTYNLLIYYAHNIDTKNILSISSKKLICLKKEHWVKILVV